MSIDPALVKINLSLLVLFEILGLLEDVFVDFVAVAPSAQTFTSPHCGRSAITSL
jgi:hypothetical protein